MNNYTTPSLSTEKLVNKQSSIQFEDYINCIKLNIN